MLDVMIGSCRSRTLWRTTLALVITVGSPNLYATIASWLIHYALFSPLLLVLRFQLG